MPWKYRVVHTKVIAPYYYFPETLPASQLIKLIRNWASMGNEVEIELLTKLK